MYEHFSIGKRIRELRLQRRLTQEQLAEISDLSVNFISKLEREQKNNIGIIKIIDLCNALDISISELVGDDLGKILSGLPESTVQLINLLREINPQELEKLSNNLIPVVQEVVDLSSKHSNN